MASSLASDAWHGDPHRDRRSVAGSADAVVVVERTEMVSETTVRLFEVESQPGQHVMRLGTSLRAGDVVLRGCSAAADRDCHSCRDWPWRRERATASARCRAAHGNELVHVGDKPAVGQIRNSNGPMLVSAAIALGRRVRTPDRSR